MRFAIWAILALFVPTAAASDADYLVYRKAYVSRGLADPADELRRAYARPEKEWAKKLSEAEQDGLLSYYS